MKPYVVVAYCNGGLEILNFFPNYSNVTLCVIKQSILPKKKCSGVGGGEGIVLSEPELEYPSSTWLLWLIILRSFNVK